MKLRNEVIVAWFEQGLTDDGACAGCGNKICYESAVAIIDAKEVKKRFAIVSGLGIGKYVYCKRCGQLVGFETTLKRALRHAKKAEREAQRLAAEAEKRRAEFEVLK